MDRLALSVLPLVGVALCAAPARADVTVFYAPPAPAAPLVAEVVRGPVAPPVPDDAAPAIVPPAEPAMVDAPLEPEPEPVVERSPSPRAAEPAVRIEPAPEPLRPAPSGAPIRFVRVGDGSREEVSLRLLDDDGRPSPDALTALSILARPRDEERPAERDVAAHAGDLEWVATGIRRLHPGLLLRLAAIVERFGERPFEIVSGYRPDARETSRHRIGRALDLRVVGVPVDELDAFVATLPETGVGLYPTTDFVHVDVRERRTHWVDVSGPGEPPRAPSAPTPSADTVDEDDARDPASEDTVDEDAILDAVTRGLRGVDVGR